MCSKRSNGRVQNLITGFAKNVINDFSKRQERVGTFVRCCIFFYLCVTLISLQVFKDLFEPVEFIMIQLTIIFLPTQRLGPHIEYVAFSLLGMLLGITACALSALLAFGFTSIGQFSRAMVFCSTAIMMVFFSMAMSYSRPRLRIFSVVTSLIIIIIPGIMYTKEAMDSTLFVKSIGAGLAPAIISIIASLAVFPSYSSSTMRAELENGMISIKRALESIVPLIVSFPEIVPLHDINEKLEVARKAVSDGKASLFAMNKYRLGSRYEFYRWYYSLWSYAEIQERVQVTLRHLSGLIIAVEVLHKAKLGPDPFGDNTIQTKEEHHQQHTGMYTRSEALSHVTDLLWLMLEALESTMLLLLHPTSISNTPNKVFDLEECKVDVLLTNSIRVLEDFRDDLLQDLIGIVLKKTPYNGSDPSLQNNISSKNTHFQSTEQRPDSHSPRTCAYIEIPQNDCTYGNDHDVGDNENDSGLCVFFFYFSLRQSARACLETQRSARNLYAHHVHQKRHIFWPHFFLGMVSKNDLFPQKKRWTPKIWRKGVLTIPSDFVYLMRLIFSRGDVRFGIKCSLVVVLCYIWAYIDTTRDYYYRFRGQWAVTSAVLTLNSTTGNTSSTAAQRLLGTFMGVLCAIVVKMIPNTMVFSLLGMLPFALICLYFQVFTRHVYVSRTALFGYVAVGFSNPSVPISSMKMWSEDDLTSTLILAATRSLTVLVGTVFAIVGSYIIFPTFSRIRLRLTIARVLRSAASLLTERIAHHLRQVQELTASSEKIPLADIQTEVPVNNTSSRKYGHKIPDIDNITWAEAHAISHSLYKGTKVERKTRINVSLLAIHALISSAKSDIQFASDEPDLDRPFNQKIYSAIIERCASIVNLLSIIEGALESQVFEELDLSSLMLVLWNSHYHGVASLTATMYILSNALSVPQLQPLPACLPLGLARQDLNRIKTHLLRTVYANTDHPEPHQSSSDQRDASLDNITSPSEKLSDSQLLFLSSSENLLIHNRRPATTARSSLGSSYCRPSGNKFSISDLPSSYKNHRIPRTATTAGRYKTTNKYNNQIAVDSVAVLQAADATLKLRSKNVPPYNTLFQDSVRKTSWKRQGPINSINTSFPTTEPRNCNREVNSSDSDNNKKSGSQLQDDIINGLTRSDRNFAPSVSLVDIYIYAYYYAVECLINEVEKLETEVEKLLGRELSFEIIPSKPSFNGLIFNE